MRSKIEALPDGTSITWILSVSFWMYWYSRIWSESDAASALLAVAWPLARAIVAAASPSASLTFESAWPWAWATAWSAWIFFWARIWVSVWTCCWATCFASIACWKASLKLMFAM